MGKRIAPVMEALPYSPLEGAGGRELDNYTVVFDFERHFDISWHHQWMVRNWHTTFYYCALYLIVVFGGQEVMRKRAPMQLRGALAAWNTFWAVFSIVGTMRTVPDLIYELEHYGFHFSVCDNRYIVGNQVGGFWTWLFVISKLPELGDTIFIVLRKQNLIFLHWYHHITVLIFTWYTYKEYLPVGLWYVSLNYSVHGVMYAYFALRALRIRVPRPIAMVITVSQIAQMIVGCYIGFHGLRTLAKKERCCFSLTVIMSSLLMYFSYFILFMRFFYQAYLSKNAVKLAAKKID